MVAKGGFEVAFHGGYLQIVPNERIVWTETYEAMPDAEAVNTLTLTETDGAPPSRYSCSTRARSTVTHISATAWKAACRKRWTTSSSWPSRSA
jgi:uncharacterized protein YndB with AHSA1/START domain